MEVKSIATRIFPQVKSGLRRNNMRVPHHRASLTKALTLTALLGASALSAPLMANNGKNISQGKAQTELSAQSKSSADSIITTLSTQIEEKKKQIKEKNEQKQMDQTKQLEDAALKKQQAKQKLKIAKLEYELETGEDADKLLSGHDWVFAGFIGLVGVLIGYILGGRVMLNSVKENLKNTEQQNQV